MTTPATLSGLLFLQGGSPATLRFHVLAAADGAVLELEHQGAPVVRFPLSEHALELLSEVTSLVAVRQPMEP